MKMKKMLNILFFTALVLGFTMSCQKESYEPVKNLVKMDAYYAVSSDYGNDLTKDLQNKIGLGKEIYEMYIYKGINKVTIFEESNQGNCLIFKTENFVDRTTTKTDANNKVYPVYDIEFDLILTDKKGNDTGQREHYKFYVEMSEAIQTGLVVPSVNELYFTDKAGKSAKSPEKVVMYSVTRTMEQVEIDTYTKY